MIILYDSYTKTPVLQGKLNLCFTRPKNIDLHAKHIDNKNKVDIYYLLNILVTKKNQTFLLKSIFYAYKSMFFELVKHKKPLCLVEPAFEYFVRTDYSASMFKISISMFKAS